MWLRAFFRFLCESLQTYESVAHTDLMHSGVAFESKPHFDTTGLISVYYHFPDESLIAELKVHSLKKGWLRSTASDTFEFPAGVLVAYSLGSDTLIRQVAAAVATWAVRKSGLE